MSGHNADLVREVYRAGSERAIERAMPLLDEDVVLDVSAVAVGLSRCASGRSEPRAAPR